MNNVDFLGLNEVDEEKLSFFKKQGSEIALKSKVKVIKCNKIIDVQYIQRHNCGGFEDILKLDKETYMIKSTGEVKEYNKSNSRADNTAGVKESMKKLRLYINNNFTGAKGEFHVTMTYAENMTDLKRLKKDFERFWKKFKYKYPEAEYIAVVEPQGRGAWHLHVLLKTSQKFIKNNDTAEMWGQGFCKTSALDGIDNIGAYLTSYFANLEIEQYTDLTGKEEVKNVDGKAYVKGARLKLYPPGMNIYRCSKGIKEPEEELMTYSQLKKITGSRKPRYSVTTTIAKGSKLVNQFSNEQYNLND